MNHTNRRDDAHDSTLVVVAPAAAIKTSEEDELAAADAEIDAEDEAIDGVDEDDDQDDDDEGRSHAGDDDDDEFDDGEAGDDEEQAGDDTATAPSGPALELTSDVYARIQQCLGTQLAAIEAQIARAERVAESDPFFDRWRVVLLAQRERLQKQIAEAAAKAPAGEQAARLSPEHEPESISA